MSKTISIITVVYKDLIGLKKTVKNILALNSIDFEHIIIDGGSGYETVRFLKKNEALYKEKKIEFKWLSETDTGIFDAMNKGIGMAKGGWLNFMNAGDVFTKKNILNKIIPHLKKPNILIYGNKLQNNKIIKSLPLTYLQVGIIMACHQSMFFNKKKMSDDFFYDTEFKIYADYELVNRIYKKYPLQFKYLDIEIAIFQGGGISESISYQKRKDKLKIVFKAYGLRGIFKTYVFKYFPNFIQL